MVNNNNDPRILSNNQPSEWVQLKEKSYGELLINKLRELGDHVIMINGENGEQLTAAQLLNQSLQIAWSLTNAGIVSDDKISIVLENCFEYLAIAFGTIIIGAIIVPINFIYSELEMKHTLDLIQPKMVFTSDKFVANISKVSIDLGLHFKIIQLDNNGSYWMYPNKNVSFIDSSITKNDYRCNEVDLMKKISLILMSSGTTGLPKGVLHPQYNLIRYYARFKMDSEIFHKNGYKPMRFVVAPFAHAYGIMNSSALILNRITIVFLPKFHLKLFLATIEKYKIEFVYTTPPIQVMLSKHPMIDEYDLSSIKYMACGAAMLTKDTILSVQKRLGPVKIRQNYGMSEMMGCVSQNDRFCSLGSIGQLRPGVSGKVIDIETGQLLGPNQLGEMVFSGGTAIVGYLTKDGIIDSQDANGWYWSGDIGYYDENKEWFCVDRVKEIIKYKGYQVSPNELEELILKHSKVADCAVIGIPHDEFGDLVTAFVVVKPNERVLAKEIIDFVAARISAPKHLHGGVRFLNEIPKSNTGKILRRNLQALAVPSKL